MLPTQAHREKPKDRLVGPAGPHRAPKGPRACNGPLALNSQVAARPSADHTEAATRPRGPQVANLGTRPGSTAALLAASLRRMLDTRPRTLVPPPT